MPREPNQDPLPGSLPRPPGTPASRNSLAIFLRGFLMGSADSVPGVSGGTVALVSGIYQRLVVAISRVNRRLLTLLWQRQWQQAAGYADLAFLATLLVGVLTGLLATTTLVHSLLSDPATQPYALASLLGMLLACTWIVVRSLRTTDAGQLARMLVGGLLAAALAWLITQQPKTDLSPSYGWLFLSGMVGISAMILPGISGAMILMVMGVYLKLIGIPAALLKGQQLVDNLLTVLVFASGCLLGLVLFSRLLKHLLDRYRTITMAVLCGAMVGSLRALWPFQRELAGDELATGGKTIHQLYWPASFGSAEIQVLATGLLSAGLVILVSHLARAHENTPADLPPG